jgi:nicotinic acid mononucleotide adenylyltransferase
VVHAPDTVNPEQSGRPRRRSLSAEAKLRILLAADRAEAVEAMLRREGLRSSVLMESRRPREARTLDDLERFRRDWKPSAVAKTL